MRVEWSHDGAAILVCARGRARVVDGTGALIFAIAVPALDARWTPRGVIAIDTMSTIRGFDGGLATEERVLPAVDVADAASLAAGGWRFARRSGVWTVCSARGVELWRDPTQWADRKGVIATLSDDGQRIAIAGASAMGASWDVFDVETGARLDTAIAPPARAVAFDGRGELLGLACADGPSHVVRLRAPRVPARVADAGGCAVALDPRGVLAAFAYDKPPTGARGRIRIDTLDGGDVFWLETELPAVAGLAFDPDSHRIACAAPDGAIEVLPVP